MSVRDSGRPASKEAEASNVGLGERIARVRADAGLSLRALSEESGVSSSMLSDVERGTKSPTIAVLSAIASAFGMRLSELLEDSDAPDARTAVRRAAEIPAVVDARGVRRLQISPRLAGAGCEIVRMTIPRGAATGPIRAHARGTFEYVAVASGTVDVRIGRAVHRLGEGDCICFCADATHEYTNRGARQAALDIVLEHPR